jgi:hypothetical protein
VGSIFVMSWNQTEVMEARQAILETARSVLSEALSPIEGARIIVKHCFTARLDNDPDIVRIIGIASETDALPLGSERQHWQAKALTDLEPEISEAQFWARKVGTRCLQNVLARSADLLRWPN